MVFFRQKLNLFLFSRLTQSAAIARFVSDNGGCFRAANLNGHAGFQDISFNSSLFPYSPFNQMVLSLHVVNHGHISSEEIEPITPQKYASPESIDPLLERSIHFFAGVIGGAAGVLAGHPLDTVKVRLQTQQGNIYRGTWHCFGSIVKKEGFRGLYKGLSSPLASLSAINAIVFGVHGSACREFDNSDSLKAHFFAGSAAGFTQSIIAAPTERLKLLMQIQTDKAHTVYTGPIHAARQIIKTQGSRALFRGSLATISRDTPAFGVYFLSYEWMTRKMSGNGTTESLAGGAGMISWLLNYPQDIIKSRFQADDSYRSYWHCIKSTYAERGIRTFFIGLNSALIRSVIYALKYPYGEKSAKSEADTSEIPFAFPSNAATFFTVEWTYRLLLNYNVLGFETVDVQQQSQMLYIAGQSASPLPVPVASNHPHTHLHEDTNSFSGHSHHCYLKKARLSLRSEISSSDFWSLNYLLPLPEAGSTSIDPMVHGCRFL
ncbi:hypothetical protein WR25_07647 [Diploscapter pachys]|uniref:Uncharacterized protein n=1 Tax=Diploscapter pachys TaxID=2018661 RepID=A0A2A2LUX0_9BILA|nr:hypothetical protein WR25_07647 [Diploscapter pachys]